MPREASYKFSPKERTYDGEARGAGMNAFYPIQPPAIRQEPSDSGYRYREYRPGRRWEPYVVCYWTLRCRASEIGVTHRILPDSCVDMIFDLQASSDAAGAFAVGVMTAYETLRLNAETSLFGIRFYSDRAHSLFGYPVSELKGDRAPLSELWGSRARLLLEEIREASGVADIIAAVESLFSKVWSGRAPSSDPLLRSSMACLYAAKGAIDVRTLAERCGYSERTVRRVFQAELGVSPKQMIDVIRFQSILMDMHRGNRGSFADLAFKYGYFDQSHFNRTFKRLYGLAPGEVF